MGKRILIFGFSLLLTLGLFAGCGSISSVEDSKEMLDDYYDAFSDEDFDDIVDDMFHPALVDDVGGEDVANDALANRYAFYGDIDDYTITGTSFESGNGVTEVTLSVRATYDTGDTLDEEFVFLADGDDLSIITIDLE